MSGAVRRVMTASVPSIVATPAASATVQAVGQLPTWIAAPGIADSARATNVTADVPRPVS
jgi:hypothetical protein